MYVGYNIHWDTGFTLTPALFAFNSCFETYRTSRTQRNDLSTIANRFYNRGHPTLYPGAAGVDQPPHGCAPKPHPSLPTRYRPSRLGLHFGQGRAPLRPYTCRAVFPSCHTLAGSCSPHATHLQGRVPLMPHTYRSVFPSCHTLAGSCSPHATHLQGRVPLVPHTCRAVFPSHHTLAGPCFPLTTHLQGRVPLMPHTCRDIWLAKLIIRETSRER